MHNICKIGAKYERWPTSSNDDGQKSIFIYIPPQIYESIGAKKLHRLSLADFLFWALFSSISDKRTKKWVIFGFFQLPKGKTFPKIRYLQWYSFIIIRNFFGFFGVKFFCIHKII